MIVCVPLDGPSICQSPNPLPAPGAPTGAKFVIRHDPTRNGIALVARVTPGGGEVAVTKPAPIEVTMRSFYDLRRRVTVQ